MASIPSNMVREATEFATEASPAVSDIREDTRTTQFTSGIKQGLIKGSVESVLEQIADPLVDKLAPWFHDIHPGLAIADPAIKSAIEFAVLLALAEILQIGGPAIAKVPGIKMSPEEAQAKCLNLAEWMRKFSGEKLGEDLAETAAELVPAFVGMLKEANFGELMSVLDEEDDALVLDEEPLAFSAQTAFAGNVGQKNVGGG